MPRPGNIPTGASPASRFGERPRAGPIALTNSSQGEDHSISSRGASLTVAVTSAKSGGASFTAWDISLMLPAIQNSRSQYQFRRPDWFPFGSLWSGAAPEHSLPEVVPVPPSRVSRLLQDAPRSSWNQGKPRQWKIAYRECERRGTV